MTTGLRKSKVSAAGDISERPLASFCASPTAPPAVLIKSGLDRQPAVIQQRVAVASTRPATLPIARISVEGG